MRISPDALRDWKKGLKRMNRKKKVDRLSTNHSVKNSQIGFYIERVGIVIAVDSNGFKVTNRGEMDEEKEKWIF